MEALAMGYVTARLLPLARTLPRRQAEALQLALVLVVILLLNTLALIGAYAFMTSIAS
jgi:hypothetical protein